MGVVKVQIEILSPWRKETESLEVLVDTGATLSVLPETLLERLGVERIGKVKVRVGDRRRIVREVGIVQLRVQGQLAAARVIFGKPKDPTVLGLTVLEQLGLTIDPVERRLVPTELLLLSRLTLF